MQTPVQAAALAYAEARITALLAMRRTAKLRTEAQAAARGTAAEWSAAHAALRHAEQTEVDAYDRWAAAELALNTLCAAAADEAS